MLKVMIDGEVFYVTCDVRRGSVLSVLSRLVLAGGGGGAQAHVCLICVY